MIGMLWECDMVALILDYWGRKSYFFGLFEYIVEVVVGFGAVT